MSDQRHLDPIQVKAMGERYYKMAQTLKRISANLDAQMRVLETSAFKDLVGQAAVARYINSTQPRIDALAMLCGVLAEDAIKSAEDWERAQLAG
jgi:hypothetical protein